MNLLLLILIPLATAIAVLIMRNATQVKWVSLLGSVAQFILAFVLLFAYRAERLAGDTNVMMFEKRIEWFPSWHISFHIGVDGISIAMILLTAFVVMAGVLVSWNVTKIDRKSVV